MFVFLTIFNFLNARKLKKDEVNIFTDIFDNYLFIVIVGIIFMGQLFIIQFGGAAFELIPLSMNQHLVCIGIGSTVVVWAALCKMIVPDSWFNNFEVFKEDQAETIINVDSIFERYSKTPATERRKSKAGKKKESSKEK